MNIEDRRQCILDLVNTQKEISFLEIREAIPDVSEMTLRRDLEYLSQNNKLVRVLGGAKSVDSLVSISEDAFVKRYTENIESKTIIAQKAVQLLQQDSTIFLGSGTTAMQVAKHIPNGRYHITTTGLNCAIELSALEDASIFVLGGSVNKNSYCANGSVASQMVDNMSFYISFLGISGYVSGRGFFTSVVEDYILRQKIVERSEHVAILMDSTKVARKGIYSFAQLENVDYVITDGMLPQEIVDEMTAKGVTVL